MISLDQKVQCWRQGKGTYFSAFLPFSLLPQVFFYTEKTSKSKGPSSQIFLLIHARFISNNSNNKWSVIMIRWLEKYLLEHSPFSLVNTNANDHISEEENKSSRKKKHKQRPCLVVNLFYCHCRQKKGLIFFTFQTKFKTKTWNNKKKWSTWWLSFNLFFRWYNSSYLNFWMNGNFDAWCECAFFDILT